MSNQRHIGIYSGTFDPVHPGHIAFAAQAMRECGLDTVVFLPEPQPRSKRNVTGMTHRLALIALATEYESRFSVLELTAPYFTVRDTLPELQQEFGNAHFTFLMGSDVARSVGRWHDVTTLLLQASLAIGIREGDDPAAMTAAMERLGRQQGIPARYTLISAPNADISSSRIRDRLPAGAYLPGSMLAYIRQHGLYTVTPSESA